MTDKIMVDRITVDQAQTPNMLKCRICETRIVSTRMYRGICSRCGADGLDSKVEGESKI